MKIALFTDTFPPQVNGVANTVYRYAVALSSMGHDVRIFTISSRPAIEFAEQYGEGSVHLFPSLPALVYPGERMGIPYVGVLTAVREFNPDIIHTHTPFSVGRNAVYAARKLSIPLVGTHHTFFNHYLKHIHLDFAWASKLVWKLTVKYYNHCDVVISPTRSLKEGLVSHGLIKPIELLSNMLDTSFFTPAATQKRGEQKTLVYMGRLSYEKNINDVISAAALVAQKIPDMRLLLIGDGPERSTLEKQAEELGIASQTVFTGYLYGQELVSALQQSDAFMTGSKSENMPLALLEAMAVGLPIVAVRSLGLEEMLRHNKNAFLTVPDSPEELAERALEFLQDDALCKKFGEVSRSMSLAYSPQAVMDNVVALYKRVSEYASSRRATSA